MVFCVIGFFDSVLYQRENFYALVGIGILEDSLRSVESKYYDFLNPTIEMIRNEFLNYVYVVKSDHISKLLPENLAEEIFSAILKKCRLLENIIITYTKFRGKLTQNLIDECVAYGLGKNHMEILMLISNFYPLVTLSSSLKHFKINSAYLDEIHGPNNLLWKETIRKTKVIVVPRGDFQYPGLALADIVLASIVIELKKRKKRLDENALRKIIYQTRLPNSFQLKM